MGETGADRSREAFEQFYERNAKRLLLHLVRRLQNVETATEVWAECWAAAFTSWRSCRASSEQAQEAWLFGIARHQLAAYYRTGAVRRRALERLGWQVPALDETSQEESRLELEALRTALAEALGQLSEKRRRAVQLRIVAGLTYEEVAARLGCSEQAARANVSRGLRKLGELLDRQQLTQLAQGGLG